MFYEFNHYGLAEHFCKEYGTNFSFPIHLHHSFEVIIILEGEMNVTVSGTTYNLKAGEAVLVFPNQTHELKSDNSRHMLCIFSPELVKAYQQKILDKRPVSSKTQLESYIISAIDKLNEFDTLLEKKAVLYTLCASFDRSAIYTDKNDKEHDLLYKIFTFVEQNFQGECSLFELSKITGYSYSYISRYFKAITQIQFVNYVSQYRIRNACYLLSNTDDTILKCALESGYTSLRSFNRNFTRFLGITPTEYRRKQNKIE